MIWTVVAVVWLIGTLLLFAWLAGDVASTLVDDPTSPPRAPTARTRGLGRSLASGLDDLRALARDRRSRGRRLTMYLAGCVLWSLGVKLFIDADLGVDPLHSMVIGLVQAIGLPFVQVGIVTTAVTLAFLLLWSIWNRKAPPLSTLLTMAAVGFLVDLWNLLDVGHLTTSLLAPVPRMMTGLLLEAYASALIIMSGIGIRVMDLVAITMTRRWRLPFVVGKMGLEIGFVTTAAILGGPIGLGTVSFLIIVAPFIPSFMWANARLLHLPNHGLASVC